MTLVERNADFVSCPLSNLVVGGQLRIADITQQLRRAARDRRQGRPRRGHRDRRRRRAACGWPAATSWPTTASSSRRASTSILDAHRRTGRGDRQRQRRPRLESRPADGRAAPRSSRRCRPAASSRSRFPRTPYRCPPAPYERALPDRRLPEADPTARQAAGARRQPRDRQREGAVRARHRRALRRHRRIPAEQRTAAGRRRATARLDFDDVRADLLNVIPPQRGGDIARAAGLLNMNSRWAGVDWLTMESTVVPRIHLIGDTVFPAPAMAKSGHIANQQAKVAAAAVIQLLRGRAGEQRAGGVEHLLQPRHRGRRGACRVGAPLRRRRRGPSSRCRGRAGYRRRPAPTKGVTRWAGRATSGPTCWRSSALRAARRDNVYAHAGSRGDAGRAADARACRQRRGSRSRSSRRPERRRRCAWRATRARLRRRPAPGRSRRAAATP